MADTETLAILIVSRTSPDLYGSAYINLSAEIVTLAEDGTPRNITTTWPHDPMAPYYGIRATAQADRAYPDNGRTFSYAWTFGLSTSTHDTLYAEHVALILATLRRATKRFDATADRFGQPATFGAYVARLADALGIATIVMGRPSTHGTYTDGAYRTSTPADAISAIDDLIAQHRA